MIEKVKKELSMQDIKNLSNDLKRNKKERIKSEKFEAGVLNSKLVVSKGINSVVIDVGKVIFKQEKEKSSYAYSEHTDIKEIKNTGITIYAKNHELGDHGVVNINNIPWSSGGRRDGTPRGDLEYFPWKIKTDNLNKAKNCNLSSKNPSSNVTIYLTLDEFNQLVKVVKESFSDKEDVKFIKKTTSHVA